MAQSDSFHGYTPVLELLYLPVCVLLQLAPDLVELTLDLILLGKGPLQGQLLLLQNTRRKDFRGQKPVHSSGITPTRTANIIDTEPSAGTDSPNRFPPQAISTPRKTDDIGWQGASIVNNPPQNGS